MIGTREIVFAIIAMTLTLAAVYAPIALTPGRTGRLFIEFALALAGAVLVSGFVALTLTPMMCSRLLKRTPRRGASPGLSAVASTGSSAATARLLDAGARPLLAVRAAGRAGAGRGGRAVRAHRRASCRRPRTAAISRPRCAARKGRRSTGPRATASSSSRSSRAVPEVESTFLIAGVPEVTRGIVVIRLKPWEERTRSQQEMPGAAPKLAKVPGVVAVPSSPPSLGQDSRSPPVQLVIQTSGSYEELAAVTERFVRAVEGWPGVTDVNGELSLATPQLEVSSTGEKIADLGSSVDRSGVRSRPSSAGREVTRFNRDAEQYDVIVQVADADRQGPDDLAAIYVRGRGGEMVQLSNLVTSRETVAPRS